MNRKELDEKVRAYNARALMKQDRVIANHVEYVVCPWGKFSLTKAERKNKTPEQIMKLRKSRWKAERVISRLGREKAMEYGVINADHTFNEAKYDELVAMARDAQAEAQRLEMVKKLEPVKATAEQVEELVAQGEK